MKTLILLLLAAFTLSAQAPHAVTLAWSWTQGTGAPATGYNVKRGTVTGGPYTQLSAIASPNTKTYVDSSGTGNVLPEGQKFCYVVTAVGQGGESLPSPEACATIPFSVPPPSPTGLAATAN
jgi:hypothetical protein